MINSDKYKKMLDGIKPKYIRAVFAADKCPVPLIGEDIKRHIRGCKSVMVCAATFGEEFDRTLRKLQLEDMAGAVIFDSMAGEELERFCDESDSELIKGITATAAEGGQCRLCGLNLRFSPGYGDFPLSVNRDIVTVLNASTRIGLCVTEDYILTPQKSITGIVGIL